jgi:hypothetical protein
LAISSSFASIEAAQLSHILACKDLSLFFNGTCLPSCSHILLLLYPPPSNNLLFRSVSFLVSEISFLYHKVFINLSTLRQLLISKMLFH